MVIAPSGKDQDEDFIGLKGRDSHSHKMRQTGISAREREDQRGREES